jgi:GntR family transcriptional regulator, transcriptional repressor for pyruvate dehydrogenase complex
VNPAKASGTPADHIVTRVPDGDRANLEKIGQRGRMPKTSELIARELVNYIVSGDLAEGQRLPAEHEMVAQMGVSRATVREAMRLLETRGAIVVRPGRNGGPVVRRPRAEDLSEALTLLLQFEGATMLDIIQARLSFEPMIARYAASRIKADEVEVLAGTVETMRADLDDHDTFLAENHTFHALIAQVSGNPVLRIFTETLKSLADGGIVGIRATAERRGDVAGAHERIVEALRAGDPDAAEQAMHDHLDEANEYWLREYGPLVSQPVRWVH